MRRDRENGETTPFRLDSKPAPNEPIVGVGLASDSGRYRVVAETAADRRGKNWTGADDGGPSDAMVRVLEDGTLDVSVLFVK